LDHPSLSSLDANDLRSLERIIRRFSEEREWEAFHVPKNLVMALAVEAAELMEPFQWLTPEEAGALKEDPEAMERLGGEMADVAIYLIRLADVMGVDLGQAITAKVRRNDERFPVDRIRGRARMPGASAGGEGAPNPIPETGGPEPLP
jgi:dCTP diphosphatase